MLINLRTYAVTPSSLSSLPYWVQSIISSSNGNFVLLQPKIWVVTVGFFMSSVLVISLAGMLHMSGHWSSCWWRNSGPFHHKSHAPSFFPFISLEGTVQLSYNFKLPRVLYHVYTSRVASIPVPSSHTAVIQLLVESWFVACRFFLTSWVLSCSISL